MDQVLLGILMLIQQLKHCKTFYKSPNVDHVNERVKKFAWDQMLHYTNGDQALILQQIKWLRLYPTFNHHDRQWVLNTIKVITVMNVVAMKEMMMMLAILLTKLGKAMMLHIRKRAIDLR